MVREGGAVIEPIILFKSLVGSRAYNLHTADSDYDYRYVQVSPLRHALSPFRRLDTKVKIEGNEDDTIWELSAFLKYCANGNPSVYEALFSAWLSYGGQQCQPLVDELLANKVRFLDAQRVYDAHRRYATAQLKNLDWEDVGPRTRKAIVAYLRVLRQGAELLVTGNAQLHISDGRFRDFLMGIKESPDYVRENRGKIEKLMQIREKQLLIAFEGTKLDSPDYDWIEEFNECCYRTLFS